MFAIRTTDIVSAAPRIRQAGYQDVGPAAGSRVLPSGKTLRWKTLRVVNTLGPAEVQPVPFLIQWAPDAPHPSGTAPAGCRLESLEVQNPRPSDLTAVLKTIGIEAKVTPAANARIVAAITTPKGRVELS